jgi:type IV secretion system protein TrbB
VRDESEERAYLQRRFDALLGPALSILMQEPTVADLMINPDGQVFIERVGEHIEATGVVLPSAQTLALIKTLASVTDSAKVHDAAPILEARVPGLGWRFEGLLPPITLGPTVSIRKPAQRVYRMTEYVASSRMSPEVHDALCAAVRDRHNVLVVGGTGSGKTTLANAVLCEIAEASPSDRIVIIEDLPELQSLASNSVALRTTRHVGMSELLRCSLRLRPDRIVVGEVRGAEALVVLKAWNTGHPGGLCTLHANSACGGLEKITQLAAEGTGGFLPRQEVAAAVQLVVFIARTRGHRRVEQLIRVHGVDAKGEFLWTEIAR